LLYPKLKVLITTAHSNYEGGKVIDTIYHYTDFLTDFNTNVSKEAVQRYINDGLTKSSKISCIYNGIDTESFSSK
jgi:ribosomal protein S16